MKQRPSHLRCAFGKSVDESNNAPDIQHAVIYLKYSECLHVACKCCPRSILVSKQTAGFNAKRYHKLVESGGSRSLLINRLRTLLEILWNGSRDLPFHPPSDKQIILATPLPTKPTCGPTEIPVTREAAHRRYEVSSSDPPRGRKGLPLSLTGHLVRCGTLPTGGPNAYL